MALNCEWPASFMQVLGEINSGLKWNMYLCSKKEKIELISVLRLFFISLILLTHFREYLGYDFFAELFFKNGLGNALSHVFLFYLHFSNVLTPNF